MDGLVESHIFQLSTTDDQYEWWFTLSYAGRLVGYLAILGLLVLVVSLIMKYLEECGGNNGSNEDRFDNSETSPLRMEKAVPVTYGTYEFDDLESGATVELYDGKVCIICYDEERNCFFVPCGHCATCIACAKRTRYDECDWNCRIFDGESKKCPVCRRYIGKVKKLFAQ